MNPTRRSTRHPALGHVLRTIVSGLAGLLVLCAAASNQPALPATAGGAAVPTLATRDGQVDLVAKKKKNQTVKLTCGYISCTMRFDRAQTRNIADGGAATGIAGGVCAAAAPPAAPLCGAIGAVAGGYALVANRYYGSGNCLGLRNKGPFIHPIQVKKGTHNCR